ncbi:MAG: energy transducer TonB [bacterium]
MMNFSKATILLILLIAFFSSPVFAQSSPIDAFKAYDAALSARDQATALSQIELAYERAVEQWEPGRKETGFMASHYALMLYQVGNKRKAEKIYQACEDILVLHLPGTKSEVANCQLHGGYMEMHLNLKPRAKDSMKRVLQTLGEIHNDDLDSQDMAGEATLALASLYLPEDVSLVRMDSDYSHKLKKSHEYLLEAKPFISKTKGTDSLEMATVWYLQGQYDESKRDWKSATYNYQKALDIRIAKLGWDAAITKTTYGRFRYSNSFSGLKLYSQYGDKIKWKDDCGTKIVENERVTSCILKRRPPRYDDRLASKGYFGFVEVKFDLAKDGSTKNLRIFASWPDDTFEEASLDAVKNWKYSPPVTDSGENVEMPGHVVFLKFLLR